ncbi:MAG: hypothetical protein QXR63_03335 [Candidatus Bathyarchaeia archaeon]
MMVEMKTVKMKTLFDEEFELEVEEKTERHIHDPVRCMRAKGLKCRCHHCNSALHGIEWKRKLEKLDKYLEIEGLEALAPSLADEIFAEAFP